MADRLSDEDEATFKTMAFIERTSLAEQRRKALRAYAKRARRSKNVADLVAQILAWRKKQQERGNAMSNVIRLEDRRHG